MLSLPHCQSFSPKATAPSKMISSEDPDVICLEAAEGETKKTSDGEKRENKRTMFIGGFTWWTTDDTVKDLLKSVGVEDVIEVKFFENKGNGQSKGFCSVRVASEQSGSKVYSLNNYQFQNRKLLVKPATLSSLNFLESMVPQPRFQIQRQQQNVWTNFSPPTAQRTPLPFRPNVGYQPDYCKPRAHNTHYERGRYKVDNTVPSHPSTAHSGGQPFRNERMQRSYGYQQPHGAHRFPAPQAVGTNYGGNPPLRSRYMNSSWSTGGNYAAGTRSGSYEACNRYGNGDRVSEDYIQSCRVIVGKTLEYALADTAEGHFEKAIERIDVAVSRIGVSINPSDSRCDIMVKSLLDTKTGILTQLELRGKKKKDETARSDSRKRNRSPSSRPVSPKRVESSRKRRRSRSPLASKTGRRHWD